jgi:hypothetical protein
LPIEGSRFWHHGFGERVESCRLRDGGLGFMVSGRELRVPGSGYPGSEFRVPGSRIQVQNSGYLGAGMRPSEQGYLAHQTPPPPRSLL